MFLQEKIFRSIYLAYRFSHSLSKIKINTIFLEQ